MNVLARIGSERAAALALLVCLAAAAIAFWLTTGGVLDTHKNDGYLLASELTSIEEILAHRRTFAYPLLLRLVRFVSPELGVLPALQSGLFLAAVSFYFAALRRHGAPPWTAFLAAAPIVASSLHLAMAQRVLTETLGTAAIVGTLAMLLWTLSRPSRWTWAALALAVFLAYQIRPANVFLVGLVPLLAFLLRGSGEVVRRRKAALSRALLAAASTVLPFLAFCGLRWVVVGHFGLVSFGGFNLIGVAGSLISPATIAALPADSRPVAAFLHRQRRQRELKPIAGRRFRNERVLFRAWYGEFDQNVAAGRVWSRYHLLDPTNRGARVMSANGEAYWLGTSRDWVEENRRLSRLSLALLRQEPGLYRVWITQSLLGSTRWLWRHLSGVRWLAYALGAVLGVVLLRWLRADRAGRADLVAALRRAFERAGPILWLAAGSFTAHLLLVVLVEAYKRRYLEAASILVPGALAALVWELLRVRIPAHSPESPPPESA